MKSRQDVDDAICALTTAELQALRRAAKDHARRFRRKSAGRDWKDLLQQAVVRTIAGDRPWKDEVSFFQHLLGVIRSIGMKSRQEVDDAICALTATELRILKHRAQSRVRRLGRRATGRDWEDLLQEAVVRTIAGDRPCKDDVSLFQHLLGAIQSIAWMWRESYKNELLECELAGCGETSPVEQFARPADQDKVAEVNEALLKIKIAFEADIIASQVINLLPLGFTAEEIQAGLGLSKNEQGAVAKRILRNARKILS